MSWLGNMLLDLLVIGIAVSLIYITREFGSPWDAVCLGSILVMYGWIHVILTFKRMGYRC